MLFQLRPPHSSPPPAPPPPCLRHHHLLKLALETAPSVSLLSTRQLCARPSSAPKRRRACRHRLERARPQRSRTPARRRWLEAPGLRAGAPLPCHECTFAPPRPTRGCAEGQRIEMAQGGQKGRVGPERKAPTRITASPPRSRNATGGSAGSSPPCARAVDTFHPCQDSTARAEHDTTTGIYAARATRQQEDARAAQAERDDR